jgi:hypothetical protein
MKYFLIFFVFLNSICYADALSGIREVSIVVEQLGKDEIGCGISESSIEAAARIPLSNTRMRVSNQPSGAYLYLNVQALDLGSMCVLLTEVQLRKWSKSNDQVGSFWDRKYIAHIQKINMNNRASMNIESLIKEFISSWLKSNIN